MEKIKPIPQDARSAIETQLALFEELGARNTWEAITPEQFGLLFEYMPTQVGLKRMNLIAQEMQGLMESMQLVANNSEAVAVALGRVRDLRTAAAETIHWIYPDTQPVAETHEQVIFTRDDAALMDFVRETGAEHLLTPDLIPSLKHLTPDQLLLLRIEILQTYLDKWEGVKDADTGDSPGFQSPTTHLERVSLTMRQKITERIEQLTQQLTSSTS